LLTVYRRYLWYGDHLRYAPVGTLLPTAEGACQRRLRCLKVPSPKAPAKGASGVWRYLRCGGAAVRRCGGAAVGRCGRIQLYYLYYPAFTCSQGRAPKVAMSAP
jgi:hypothetical protein